DERAAVRSKQAEHEILARRVHRYYAELTDQDPGTVADDGVVRDEHVARTRYAHEGVPGNRAAPHLTEVSDDDPVLPVILDHTSHYQAAWPEHDALGRVVGRLNIAYDVAAARAEEHADLEIPNDPVPDRDRLPGHPVVGNPGPGHSVVGNPGAVARSGDRVARKVDRDAIVGHDE